MACWAGLGAILVMFLVSSLTAPLSEEGKNDCPKLDHQIDLDIDQLMGDWYAVETVDHVSVEEKTVSIAINVCPIVQLTREDNTTIRLKWNEKAGVIVYMFHQPRKNEPGFWISAGNQNGSLADKYNVQFSGTVHVMKAVSSHVVLTFCSRPDLKMYTVLMSRTKRLPHTEVRGVNNLLVRRRHLGGGHFKEMCKGAAASTTRSLAVLSLLVVHFVSCWH